MEELLARQKKAILAVCIAAAAVLGAGAFLRHGSPGGESASVEIIEPADQTPAPGSDPLPDMSSEEAGPAATAVSPSPASPQAPPEGSKVVVHVAGAVKTPGVYTLEAGKRVMDALKAAGGAKPSAELDAVNLARKLEDGEQIYIPRKGSTASPALPGPPGAAAVSAVSPAGAARTFSRQTGPAIVNINTAGPEELDRLPGVGPATAQKIIEYRRAAGGFSRPEELLNVKGIGEKKFADMKPYVVVR